MTARGRHFSITRGEQLLRAHGSMCVYMCTVLGSPASSSVHAHEEHVYMYVCTMLGSPRSTWKDKLLYTLHEILLWTKAWIQQGRDGSAKRRVGYHVT